MQRSPHSLFHYKTLEKRMLSFGFPKNLSDRLQVIKKWVAYIQSGNQPNPVSDAEFIHDLCVDVLGYRSPFIPNTKTWELEFTPTPALGFFGTESSHVLAEIIIDDIWVQPQLNYATTAWVIVTNYKWIRLYARESIGIFYEQFNLEDIVDNYEYLKQFYFMLCRRTLLSANSQEQSRLSKLLDESQTLIQDVINNFYYQYCKIRGELIKDFCYRLSSHSDLKSNLDLEFNHTNIKFIAIAKAQKLLNRILFISYAQNHHLLPNTLIINAFEFINPYIYQPIWANYKAIFSWIYKGNAGQSVFGYGSSLFEHDPILDELLFVGDELCRQIKELSRFNFYDDISDLAIAYILEELNKDVEILKIQDSFKRKKLKYPSKILQMYESVENLVKSQLNRKVQLETSSQINSWTLHKIVLENFKIYAPECKSGIFLVLALNILLRQYQQIYDALNLESDPKVAVRVLPDQILQNQIYGSDRNSESVEITKLNLWLHTITANQTLLDLDHNIQVGNSPSFSEIINLAQTTENLLILK
ncbi:hypothetical protein Syn7502_01564 [Synechococcus sp. PCC 7502]|uniref:hypothetical protein n=1 Tax=Synechococcus sp. PCC 7502 TaxID=1173263 RepID=UPI00029FB371|nr:hypothetical protein [Synechococcus sp. PCC 7502]AFY73626.1 hypothetical protein Syn7502_01564 [Synechococcus sp. PCC 7502]